MIKFARLAYGLGLSAWFTGCAAQGPSEAAAPAVSSFKTVPVDERAPAPAPGSPGALPAPAPPAAAQGLGAARSNATRDEAELTTLDAAERALNQAKADLDRLALAEPSAGASHEAAADRSAEKKENRPSRTPSPAGAAAPSKGNALCEEACRAFSSLSRAASAVCRLDGSSGTHCSRAKQVLSDAQQRVASCSCPASND
jgi:hypothetical protein